MVDETLEDFGQCVILSVFRSAVGEHESASDSSLRELIGSTDDLPTAREAGVAQLVEQLIRNQQVIGSSPIAGSNFPEEIRAFRVPRRQLSPKAQRQSGYTGQRDTFSEFRK